MASDTFLNGVAVVGLYVYSVDNNPEEAEFIAELNEDPTRLDYYEVPNTVYEWGASVLVDHLDSMRHVSKCLVAHDAIAFVIKLNDGRIIALTQEIENQLRSG